jgi:hypothetical protein
MAQAEPGLRNVGFSDSELRDGWKAKRPNIRAALSRAAPLSRERYGGDPVRSAPEVQLQLAAAALFGRQPFGSPVASNR